MLTMNGEKSVVELKILVEASWVDSAWPGSFCQRQILLKILLTRKILKRIFVIWVNPEDDPNDQE